MNSKIKNFNLSIFKQMLVSLLIFGGIILLINACGKKQQQAEDENSSGIVLANYWVKVAAKADQDTKAFVTISNTGNGKDSLISAKATIAEQTQLHTVETRNGQQQMRQIEFIEIPPASSVQLKPGGLHIMLVGLKKDINEGDRIPLTLTFAESGDINIEAIAKK